MKDFNLFIDSFFDVLLKTMPFKICYTKKLLITFI